MANVSFETTLLLAGILFALGLTGLLIRRNLIFMLMSLEIMMNAAGMAFIAAGSRWMEPDGQVMFIFILTVAAVEVSVALALVMLMHKHFKTVDTEKLRELE